jgi:hypothetical protein
VRLDGPTSCPRDEVSLHVLKALDHRSNDKLRVPAVSKVNVSNIFKIRNK